MVAKKGQKTPIESQESNTTNTQSDMSKPVQKKVAGDNYISGARLRFKVDDNGLNRLNTEETARLKESDKAYTEAEKASTATETLTEEQKAAFAKTMEENKAHHELVELQLAALSKGRIRFSGTSGLVLSITCDAFVGELAKFAMANTVLLEKGNVKVGHLFHGKVEELPLFRLYGDLPHFVATQREYLEQAHTDAVLEAHKQGATLGRKECMKEFGNKGTKAAKEAKTKAEPQEKVPEKAPEDSEKNFRYYIGHLFADNKPQDKTLRVSEKIKMFLSKLVDEFVVKISNQILFTIECMKIKTVSDRIIKHAIKCMLVNGHQVHETLSINKVEKNPESKKPQPEYEVVHTRKWPTSAYDTLKGQIDVALEKHAVAEGEKKAKSQKK